MLMRPRRRNKNIFNPNFPHSYQFYQNGSRTRSPPIQRVQYLASPQYQSIICYSVPWGIHKLDPIMRGSNDCLCIFGLDFQLYIADITAADAVCRGIKLNFSVKNSDSVSH